MQAPARDGSAWSIVLPKYLSGEHIEVRALAPAVGRQPGLSSQLFEHRLTIPTLLGSHVGEKHRSVTALFENDPVLPHFDGRRPS